MTILGSAAAAKPTRRRSEIGREGGKTSGTSAATVRKKWGRLAPSRGRENEPTAPPSVLRSQAVSVGALPTPLRPIGTGSGDMARVSQAVVFVLAAPDAAAVPVAMAVRTAVAQREHRRCYR
jgi:hypothetical protein